jgi:hypothetical protein
LSCFHSSPVFILSPVVLLICRKKLEIKNDSSGILAGWVGRQRGFGMVFKTRSASGVWDCTAGTMNELLTSFVRKVSQGVRQ